MSGVNQIKATLLIYCLLGSVAATQEIPRDRIFEWKRIETRNFNIYYYDESVFEAVETYANWFQSAYEKLSAELQVEFKSKPHVFIYSGINDLVQSPFLSTYKQRKGRVCKLTGLREFALAEPLQRRILIPLQPSWRSSYWFAVHELVHMFQFEVIYSYNIPSFLYITWGPVVPDWFWEGFADYKANIFETRKFLNVYDFITNNPEFDMDDLFDFENLLPQDFVLPYDIGAYFFKFLEGKYGKEVPIKMFHTFANNFPITTNGIVLKSVGKDLQALRGEFIAYILEKGKRYEGKRDEGEMIADFREYYSVNINHPDVRDDWGTVTTVTNYRGKDDITMVDMESGEQDSLFGIWKMFKYSDINSPVVWNGKGTKFVYSAGYYNHDRIIIQDQRGGDERQITLKGFDQILYPSFYDDNTLLFSGFKDGRSDIYLYAIKSDRIKNLTDDVYWDSRPLVSPDKSMIAYISERNYTTNIYIISSDDYRVLFRFETWALVRDISWSEDSKYIVFSSDIGGKYDIYAFRPRPLETDETFDKERGRPTTGYLYRLTDEKLGAFFPSLNVEKLHLVYASFENRGFVLKKKKISFDSPVQDYREQDRESEYQEFNRDKLKEYNKKEFDNEFGLTWLIAPVNFGMGTLSLGGTIQLEDLKSENTVFGSFNYFGDSTLSFVGYDNRHFPFTSSLRGSLLTVEEGSIESVGAGISYPVIPYLVLSGGIVQERVIFKELEDRAKIGFNTDLIDVGLTFGVSSRTRSGVSLFDIQEGFHFDSDYTVFREKYYSDRDHLAHTTSAGLSYALYQDYIISGSAGINYKRDQVFTIDRFDIDRLIRADSDVEGNTALVYRGEFSFPLYRDWNFKPLTPFDTGEYFVLDRFFGFLFYDAVHVSNQSVRSTFDNDFLFQIYGAGLRTDIFFLPYLFAPLRVPLRIEVWTGYSVEDEEYQSGFFLLLPIG